MACPDRVPVSAYLSVNEICSSVYRDFFIPSSLPEGFKKGRKTLTQHG